MPDINNVKLWKIDKKEPPKNLRIMTIDMDKFAPIFVDNVLKENGDYLNNTSSPTHWTYSLNFPNDESNDLYKKLSHGAKIVEKVFQWSAFSDLTKDLTPGEIKNHLTPIFGKKIIDEVMEFYKKQ